MCVRDAGIPDLRRDAKVEQDSLPAGTHKRVARLDIAVANLIGVGFCQALAKLSYPPDNLPQPVRFELHVRQ